MGQISQGNLTLEWGNKHLRVQKEKSITRWMLSQDVFPELEYKGDAEVLMFS